MRRHGDNTAVRWVSCVVALILLAGCGTTQLRVNDPKAKIFVDGTLVGEGSADLRPRMGLPGKVLVTVKRDGATLLEQELSREFTFVTLLVGMVTVYTGLLWAWQYPSELELTVPLLPAKKSGGWDDPVSPWDKPESPWDKPYQH